MNNRNINNMSPFITFCQKVIPLAYDESMSYYESICALRDYLMNTVITAVNNNADAVTELQKAFNTLQNYVDNYFKNLDVQTEINNKLDEMVEDGTLQNIIAAYLEVNSVLAFNTKEDLKNANNLNEGAFTYTFGTNEYNDGFGAFYKIRKLVNTDVINDVNILALTNYPELVAEKMPDKNFDENFNEITEQLNTINQNVTNNTNNINKLNTDLENLTKQKITVILGDSWTDESSEGNNHRDGALSWVNKFRNYSKNIVYNQAKSGTGFWREIDNKPNFINQLNEILNNDEIDNNDIVEIIIYGGLNDIDNTTISNITTSATQLANNIQTNCPNAKVYCGFYNIPNRPIKASDINNINTFENSLRDYGWKIVRAGGWCQGLGNTWASDNYHPNNVGEDQIYACVINMLNNGNGFNIPITIVSYENIESVTSSLAYNPYTSKITGNVVGQCNNSFTPNSKGTISIETNFCGNMNNDEAYSVLTLGVASNPLQATGFIARGWSSVGGHMKYLINVASVNQTTQITAVAFNENTYLS